MSSFVEAIFLLGLCLTNALNFSTVYEWDKFDIIWPSGADTSNRQIKDERRAVDVFPQYMAVFEERLFLSLDNRYSGIPASLMWLPTNGISTATPPKLAFFPSWHLHNEDMCDTIQRASGMETDTDGLLWVLDEGNSNCPGKLWIFNLLKNDKTERVHQFPHSVISHSNDDRWLNDIVLDKTPDDYLAYITVSESEKIIVYSRKLDKSWSVETPGRRWISLALSPIKEPRQLYLGRAFSEEMYSVSVSELKNEGGSAAVKFIGNWTKSPCRMLIDCSNVLYAAFALKTYLTKWNISEPFREQRLYEAEGMGHTHWPFTFDLDANGSFWMMERNLSEGWRKPRHKLLKAEVGAKSYIFCTSTALTTPQATAFSFNTILVWLLVCCLVLSGTLIAWLTLKMRRMQTSSRHISMDNLVFLGSKQSSTD